MWEAGRPSVYGRTPALLVCSGTCIGVMGTLGVPACVSECSLGIRSLGVCTHNCRAARGGGGYWDLDFGGLALHLGKSLTVSEPCFFIWKMGIKVT